MSQQGVAAVVFGGVLILGFASSGDIPESVIAHRERVHVANPPVRVSLPSLDTDIAEKDADLLCQPMLDVSISETNQCGSVTVTSEMVASCPRDWHVIIIQPRQSQDAEWMADVAVRLVDVVLSHAGTVGVVHYDGDEAQVVEPLTDDRTVLLSAVRRPHMGGCICSNVSVEDAADLAVELLVESRRGGSNELVVLFGQSKDRPDPRSGSRLESGAHTIRSAKITLLVGCPMSPTQPYCQVARTIVEDPADYAEPANRTKLPDRLDWHMARGFDGVDDISEAVVRHVLPPELRYVTDSSRPVPIHVTEAVTTELVWRWTGAAANAPMTLTYLADPIGRELAAVRSSAVITDEHGGVSSTSAVTETLVAGPCPTPTVTKTSPTPNPTPVPPTQTPTSTATRAAVRPIYLPLALSSYCLPQQGPNDVALVIDTSTSMLDSVGGAGHTKLEAARLAATTFLDHLPHRDRAAIVWFNADAGIATVLTSDRDRLREALSNLPTGQFTRIDLGIRVAREELGATLAGSERRAVIIVLTDGRSNPVPPEDAVAQAEAAKQAGTLVFTIGLGNETDLDAEALRAIASRPDWYYETPDPDELVAIYEAIAGNLPCQ